MNAETIADGAIEMFLEYRDRHGSDEETARAKAVIEILEGIAAEEELRAQEGSSPTDALPLPAPPVPVLKWCAVQVENGRGGWITYQRLSDEGAAITLATLLAREWTGLGAWRVAWIAELVVWPPKP